VGHADQLLTGRRRPGPQLTTSPPPSVAGLLPRCTFPAPGTEVVCAVSGGADSLALLILAVAAGCRATAVHVDHGLRPASAGEATVVARAATRLGAGFRAVPARVAPGPNLEARAREARFRALPPGALTGHTADDQAETMLLNLIRGAGLDGLAGIRPGPTKPILALRRRETRALCDELGCEVVEDASNADLSFRRNRVRHEALPLLDAIAARDVAAVLARQAALLHDDADLLDSLAGALDPRDARALAAAPAPLARRAVRRWLVEELRAAHPPDASTVDRVLDVARRGSGACEVVGGARVERSGMRLSIRRG
jgi:tRNA(Ile)-lysidine synthase